MRRVRERYPLFQKIRGNGGGKSRQFHRLRGRGGGSFSNPPPSPSPPRGPVVILSTVSTTVAIFLVFDDPKISSRSHGKIEISPLPPRHGKRFREPSFPLYLFYFALCLLRSSSISSVCRYLDPFDPLRKRKKARLTDEYSLRRWIHNVHLSTGQLTHILAPCNSPFSEFNLPDNETSRGLKHPRKPTSQPRSHPFRRRRRPVRKGGVWGWKGVFANPFAACYVKPTAKTMGGNGRRVGWYKANRASQERIRSLHPFFLSLPPPLPSQFSTCSFHYTPPGYLFQATSAIVFSCLLILVLRCAPLSPLWKSSSHPRPLSRPLVSLFLFLSLSFTLSAVWNFAVSSSLSEPRSRYRTFVTLEWNSLFHAFHSTLIFLVVYIYICTFGWLSPFF